MADRAESRVFIGAHAAIVCRTVNAFGELKVEELSFNSFYEYSVQRIPDILSLIHI